MKYFFRALLGILLAGAAVFVMFRVISWDDAKTAVHALSWQGIVFIVAAILTIGVVQATRFLCILHFGGIRVSLQDTIRIFIASKAFTPLPAGEVGRAMLFKKELGVHLHEIAGPVFLQALLELWTAAAWVVLLGFFVGSVGGWWGFVGFVGLLAVLTTPLLYSKRFPHFFDLLKKRGMNYKWIDKTRVTFQHFEKLISPDGKTYVRRFWMTVLLLGLSTHVLSGGLIWYIARMQGAHVTLLQGIFAATMAALIQGILVIIPGGLGVTEGGLVGILLNFAVSWRKTIVITLVYRLATLPLSIGIALLFLASTYWTKAARITHVTRT